MMLQNQNWQKIHSKYKINQWILMEQSTKRSQIWVQIATNVTLTCNRSIIVILNSFKFLSFNLEYGKYL